MTAEERRAERYDPRDADPLYAPPGDEEDMCPNCVTPWKCNGPHLSAWVEAHRAVRDRETREEFRSGAVVLYLAVILAIVAGAAIAWLWWTFR